MTIDTLEYAKKLEAAGVDRRVAEVHACFLRDLVRAKVASKREVSGAAHRLEARLSTRTNRLDFERLNARVQFLIWMVGLNIAATIAVLWSLPR